MEAKDTTEGSGNHTLVSRRAAAARSAAATPDRSARLAPLVLLVLVGVGLGQAGCTADGNGASGACRTVINSVARTFSLVRRRRRIERGVRAIDFLLRFLAFNIAPSDSSDRRPFAALAGAAAAGAAGFS